MNIFYLDKNTSVCASFTADRHVCKMIIEYAQLLSTAHFVLDGQQVGYKPTHKNHPCAVWVRQSTGNYDWLFDLFECLCREYTLRYGKHHKTSELLTVLWRTPVKIPEGDFCDPPQCMPDDCKGPDTVTAYRKLYLTHKKHFVTYKLQTPDWFTNAKA